MSDTIIQTSEKTPAIIVDRVTKTFLKRNTHSLKEAFVGWTKGKKVRADVFHALDDVSFQIGEGESVAVLGFNGSGKSTTLKMVSGVMQPDQGRVFTKGRVAGLIEVGAGFHPDLSGRENVYLNAAILGMSKEQIDARFDDIVEFSEIGDFIEQEVTTRRACSCAWRSRSRSTSTSTCCSSTRCSPSATRRSARSAPTSSRSSPSRA
jgi:ABC-2 type transport system ATP-binding protein